MPRKSQSSGHQPQPGAGPDHGGSIKTYRLCAGKEGSDELYELLRDEMSLQQAKRLWNKVIPTSVIQVQSSTGRWYTVFPRQRRRDNG